MNVKKTLKIFGFTIAAIFTLIVILISLVFILLTPGRLTPIVNSVASDYLDATVKFDSVDLTLLEDFPLVSLRLKRGEVVSHAFKDMPDSLRAAIPARADTLLRFQEFMVSGNLLDIIGGKYSIRRVRLTSPEVYAYVAPNGKANWDIYQIDTTASEEPSTPLKFDITRVSLRRTARVTYDSRPDSLLAKLSFRRFSVSGRLTDEVLLCQLKRLTLAQLKVSVDMERDGLSFQAAIDTLGIRAVDSLGRNQYNVDFRSNYSFKVGGTEYCSHFPLNMRGGFGFSDSEFRQLAIREMTMDMDILRFRASGGLELQGGDSIISSNLKLAVDSLNFGRIVELMPKGVMPELKNIRTNIIASLNATIKGSYNMRSPGTLPKVALDISSNDGYLKYGDFKEELRRVKLDASVYFNPSNADSTGMVIRELALLGRGLEFNCKASAWDVLHDPHVKGKVSGKIDLDTLSVLFPSKQQISASGIVDANFKGDFRVSQLTPARIGGANIVARLKLDDIKVSMPKDTIFATILGGRITVGANENKRDSLIEKGSRILRLSVRLDSANVNYKERYVAILSGFKSRIRSAAAALSSTDSLAVHPFTGSIQGRRIQLRDVDSSWVRVLDAKGNFSILPSPENSHVPMIELHLESRVLAMRSGPDRVRVVRANLDISATESQVSKALLARRARRLDSLQIVYPMIPRDSLSAHSRAMRPARNRLSDDFKDEDLDFKVDSKLAALIRKWRVQGQLKADRVRLTSPLFPLRNMVRKVDMTFSNKELDIRNASLKSGSSGLSINGKVSNIQRALLNNRPLRITMNIESDTLNLNELIRAANAGAVYAEAKNKGQADKYDTDDDEALQAILDKDLQTENINTLLVIPANLEANLNVKVRYGLFGDLAIDSLSGGLNIKDRVLELNNLYTKTEAGEISLTALYATRSREDITAGFDLEMNEMQVDRLIELIPMIDSITPMLRSFQGRVSCQIAATSKVDTTMNLILPSLSAAARLTGNNMVLMDGETFAEISKMLYFKNKKRNEIDKISVEMLIRNNQIEMFPFIMEIDRYRTAISGVHKLDMSFNYHVSVLKSPLPFRLGVDIFGNLDDFKFRIGRAKYKDESIPRYIELVDTTRINLRKSIAEISKRGIEAASLANMKIDANVKSPMVNNSQVEPLTAADSVAMRAEGIIPKSVVISTDTLVQPTIEKGKKRGEKKRRRNEPITITETTQKQGKHDKAQK